MLKGYPVEGRREDIESLSIDLMPKHPTFTQTGTDKYSLDVMPFSLARITEAAVVEAGSTSSRVVLTGHSAKKGDVIRITSTANGIEENYKGVHRIIDANAFELAGDLSAALAAGDDIDILRPVFNRVTEDGATLATVDAAPVSFLQGPTGSLADQSVQKDLSDANNTVGLPVQIVGSAGTEINLTAGDINVQTSHTGVNPDSMRIGNGTNLMDVNADNEALVHDQDVQDKLDAIAGQLPNSLGQKLKAASLSVVLASDQGAIDVNNIGGTISLPTGAATEAKQDSAITELQDIEADVEAGNALLTSIEAKDFATQTTLAAINTKTPSLGQKTNANSSPVVLSVSQGSHLTDIDTATTALAAEIEGTGGLNVNVADLNTLATEATLSQVSGQLPTTLGQKTAANSISVTLPSDQAALEIQREQVIDFSRVDFSATSVTDAAYTAFETDTGATAYKAFRVFYAGGEPLFLAIGAAASEADVMMIPPGADFEIGLDVPANSRLSLKAVNSSTTISSGQIIFNWVA